jgi:hypothetical protein
MEARFVKSEAGYQEIRDKGRQFSRPARNLLLIIDDSRSAVSWLEMVSGATELDLQVLIEQGLIKPAAVAPDTKKQLAVSIHDALNQFSYDQLYVMLTTQAKKQLGMIRGLKFVLGVEKCSDIDELRQLTLSFIDQVGQRQGPQAAQLLRQTLGERNPG